MQYQNPIIPGFYPDPSICRVGSKFYLVTSSFNYFPGVPLFESDDLINWHQIGHVLTRRSQLEIGDASMSGGIYAPTIRYHDGRFYMVTTNVSSGGNFYVWTDDIQGEWSDPIWVEQGGIDPSLYFEGDRAYFMSNGDDDNGVSGITQCEIEIATGAKKTASTCLWQGAGGRYLEGPHLYKIKGTYYLVASEGGTEYGHMLVYARSQTISGPYESYSQNPVLTNRNLGGYQLQGCGHADLVDDEQGNWWLVHLAFRQLDQWLQHHSLGRETCLVPVTFDDKGWFTAGDHGTTRLEMTTDRLPEIKQAKVPNWTFENTSIGKQWVYLRNQHAENYQVKPSQIWLKSTPVTLNNGQESPTAIMMRQQELFTTIKTTVTITDQEAGLALFMSEDLHEELVLRNSETGFELCRRLHIGDAQQEDHVIELANGTTCTAELIIEATNHFYHFLAIVAGQQYDLGQSQTKYLSSEVGDNFTGTMIALFSQNKIATSTTVWAKFTDFSVINADDQAV